MLENLNPEKVYFFRGESGRTEVIFCGTVLSPTRWFHYSLDNNGTVQEQSPEYLGRRKLIEISTVSPYASRRQHEVGLFVLSLDGYRTNGLGMRADAWAGLMQGQRKKLKTPVLPVPGPGNMPPTPAPAANASRRRGNGHSSG